MTSHRWLILPVEVKHREFLSRILIATAATSRGYRVLLGKDTMIRRLAPALPRGVILDKNLGLARHGKPQRFSSLGHKVVVLDEESTGYYGSPDQFLSVRLSGETLDACSRWYCISDVVRDHAIRMYPRHEDRFLTTGLVRTDTWREPFHAFYTEEKLQIAEETGRFILFNSNFGGIIHARGAQFVNKQIKGQKGAYAGIEARMQQVFAQGKRNLDAFVGVLPKVAQWFPSHRIVIRPHPSEDVSFWQQKFAGNDRIVVRGDGVATPWILASDLMFHHGCTTGIEAEILGHPHIMFAPHPDEHHDTQVMSAFAPVCRDETALQNAMQQRIDGQFTAMPSGQKARYYANLNGGLATSAILDDIDKIGESSGDLPESLPLAVRARLWLAKHKRRSQREKAYVRQKWPGTSIREITGLVDKASAGLNLNGEILVSEVFDEVFEIRSIPAF